MKSKKTKPPAEFETTSDRFNKTRSSEREAPEKSMLTFIEKQRTKTARSYLGIQPAVDESALGDGFDDFDDEDRQGLEHLMIRLGGNGF